MSLACGFQSATGQEAHPESYTASFAGPGNLHLNQSHGGNILLLGDPDPNVTNDIKGEPRNHFYHYKRSR